MLNLTDEQKALFKESGHFPGYIFTFSDIDLTITNETIHDQAVTVKESIMDSSEFTLGGCIASSIEFEVSEIMANTIAGLEFVAQMEVTDVDGNVELTIPMGTYIATTVQQVDNKDYKKIIGYDRLIKANVDVTDWYTNYFAPTTDDNGNEEETKHSIKDTRENLLVYLGIPFVSKSYSSVDEYIICEKAVEGGNLIGIDLLQMLCAVNGCFGKMNRSGQFDCINAGEIGEENINATAIIDMGELRYRVKESSAKKIVYSQDVNNFPDKIRFQSNINTPYVYYDISDDGVCTVICEDKYVKLVVYSIVFNRVNSLEEVDFSHFDFSNISSVDGFFEQCINLLRVNFCGINTTNIVSFDGVFNGCAKLEEVDVSGADFSSVRDMMGAFGGCISLKTIYANENSFLAARNPSNINGTFYNCTSLIGGNGTTYSSEHFSSDYARIDKDGEPGYLTLKAKKKNTISDDYRSLKYEEYTTKPITGVVIKGSTEDVGVEYGDVKTNPYAMIGNIFLYGTQYKSIMRDIAKEIYDSIKDLSYIPHTSSIDGLPYLETGDIFSTLKDSDDEDTYFESLVFSRTITGVASLVDTYEAKGVEERKNEITPTSEMYRTKGRQFVFQTSQDGLLAELQNFETETTTKFELTDGQIESVVQGIEKNERDITEARSEIVQTSNEIKSTVSASSKKYPGNIEATNPYVRPDENVNKVSLSHNIVGVTRCGADEFIALSEDGWLYYCDGANGDWEVYHLEVLGEYEGKFSAITCHDGRVVIGGNYYVNGSCKNMFIFYSDDYKDNASWTPLILYTNAGQYQVPLKALTYVNYTGDKSGYSCFQGINRDGYIFYNNPGTNEWRHAVYLTLYSNNLKFVGNYVYALGSGKALLAPYSPDGDDSTFPITNYSIIFSNSNYNYTDIAYGKNKYVMVSSRKDEGHENEGGIFVSDDGYNFTKLDYDFILYNIEYNSKIGFIATGQSGKTYISSNGETWEESLTVGTTDIDKGIAIQSGFTSKGSDNYVTVLYTDGNTVYRENILFSDGKAGYKVELYGYGNPTGNSFYEKDENIEKNYLDNKTGDVYTLSKNTSTGDYVWTKIDTQTALIDEAFSEIEQTSNSIVLKVDASGRIVEVGLSVSPEEGSEFRVQADNISMTAEEAINFVAGGNLNLTGKNIIITSDNFNVNSKGEVEASALTITGGGFNVSTNTANENVLILNGISGLDNVYIYTGGRVDFSYAGEGEPDDSLGDDGEFYLDITDGGTAYRKSNGTWSLFTYGDIQGDITKVKLVELKIETENGFYHHSKNYVEVSGVENPIEDMISITKDGIVFESISFDSSTGYTLHNSARIYFTYYKDEDPIPYSETGFIYIDHDIIIGGTMEINSLTILDDLTVSGSLSAQSGSISSDLTVGGSITGKLTGLTIGNKQLVVGSVTYTYADDNTGRARATFDTLEIDNTVAMDMPATVCGSGLNGTSCHPYGVGIVSATESNNAYLSFLYSQAPPIGEVTLNYSYWITI